MKMSLVAGLAASLLAAVGSAHAQVTLAEGQSPLHDISAGVDLKSQYVLSDLLVGTDEPVIQAWLSAPISEHCSAELWVSRGIATKVGAEADLGGKCSTEHSGFTVTGEAYRYVLQGAPDMTALTATVERGPVSVSVSQYFWDKNPDATQVEVGYKVATAERLSLTLKGVYETGFGLSDIYIAGAEVSYSLTDKLSAGVDVLTPVSKGKGDDRSTKVIFGLSYAF